MTEHTCNDPHLIRAKASFFSVVMMYEEKNLVRVKCDPKSVNAVIISALATFLQRWRINLGMPKILAIFDLNLELSMSVCVTEGGRQRPTRLEMRPWVSPQSQDVVSLCRDSVCRLKFCVWLI